MGLDAEATLEACAGQGRFSSPDANFASLTKSEELVMQAISLSAGRLWRIRRCDSLGIQITKVGRYRIDFWHNCIWKKNKESLHRYRAEWLMCPPRTCIDAKKAKGTSSGERLALSSDVIRQITSAAHSEGISCGVFKARLIF